MPEISVNYISKTMGIIHESDNKSSIIYLFVISFCLISIFLGEHVLKCWHKPGMN